jgi:glutathione S-transferase
MHGGFSALRNDCTMNVGVRVRPAPMRPALLRDVARVRELFEQGLDRFGGPWLAGPAFTVLDAFFAPVAFRIRTYGLDAAAAGLGGPYAGASGDAGLGAAGPGRNLAGGKS